MKRAENSVRVAIIEDHAIIRAGVRMLIEREIDIDVVFEAATASEALALFKGSADVILLEVSLRAENGLDMLPALLREFSPAKILVLTAVEDVEIHLAAVEGGASGVVLKEQAPEILVKAIYAVSGGEPWMGRALSAAAVARLSRSRITKDCDPEMTKIARLTAREKEVIAVVAKGFNGVRIAQELSISEATVRHHVTSILGKLGVSSKLELAVYAFNHGLK